MHASLNVVMGHLSTLTVCVYNCAWPGMEEMELSLSHYMLDSTCQYFKQKQGFLPNYHYVEGSAEHDSHCRRSLVQTGQQKQPV